MADDIWSNYRNLMLGGGTHAFADWNDGNVYVSIIDVTNYTYSDAHQDLSDVTTGTDPRFGTDDQVASGNVTIGTVAEGRVDYTTNHLWSSVSTSGTNLTVDAYFYYYKAGGVGDGTTMPLMIYIDSSAELPITPNGGDITCTPNASGVFGLP